MQLLIVRHAAAEERGEAAARGRPDSRRRLTPRGRRRMEHGVQGLLALGVHGDILWHSPWTRAAQTAALLVPIVSGETRSCAALARAPDKRLLDALACLAKAPAPAGHRAPSSAGRHGDGPSVVLVGHQPWLGELVAWLTTGMRAVGTGPRLGKGAVACLAGLPEPGGMELRALLPAPVLRAAGRAGRP